MPGIFNSSIFNNAIFNTGSVIATAPNEGARHVGARHRRHPRYAKYKLHPEEILRQQRMVEEYLDSLENKAPTAQEPHKKAPRFTPALARAAADVQLVKVVRAAAEARDRDMAALELRRRRHLTLALLLALE